MQESDCFVRAFVQDKNLVLDGEIAEKSSTGNGANRMDGAVPVEQEGAGPLTARLQDRCVGHDLGQARDHDRRLESRDIEAVSELIESAAASRSKAHGAQRAHLLFGLEANGVVVGDDIGVRRSAPPCLCIFVDAMI